MPMKPGSTKNLLLRLDPDLAGRLQTVADIEGRPVSDVVREVIASRTLGLDTGQVLDLLDPAAAGHALTQARPGSEPAGPATHAAALLHALVRQRPLRRGNQQVAL